MEGFQDGGILPDRLLMNARILPNRDAILPLLPKCKIIAEIGVALGNFSQQIMDVCQPGRFIAIDRFDLHTIPELWGRPTVELFSGTTHREFYHRRFADAVVAEKMMLLQGDSAAMIAELEDESVDIFYVDADHSYEAVKRDLSAISRKIRPDGTIILNDYIMTDIVAGNAPYGVVPATNEFMISQNWEMRYFALHAQMYCDVALCKVGRQGGSAVWNANGLESPENTLRETIAELERRNAELSRLLDTAPRPASGRIVAALRAARRSLRTIMPRQPGIR